MGFESYLQETHTSDPIQFPRQETGYFETHSVLWSRDYALSETLNIDREMPFCTPGGQEPKRNDGAPTSRVLGGGATGQWHCGAAVVAPDATAS